MSERNRRLQEQPPGRCRAGSSTDGPPAPLAPGSVCVPRRARRCSKLPAGFPEPRIGRVFRLQPRDLHPQPHHQQSPSRPFPCDVVSRCPRVSVIPALHPPHSSSSRLHRRNRGAGRAQRTVRNDLRTSSGRRMPRPAARVRRPTGGARRALARSLLFLASSSSRSPDPRERTPRRRRVQAAARNRESDGTTACANGTGGTPDGTVSWTGSRTHGRQRGAIRQAQRAAARPAPPPDQAARHYRTADPGVSGPSSQPRGRPSRR